MINDEKMIRLNNGVIKLIDGVTWFCCPECGKKLHPVKPGACGVLATCKGKRIGGTRCTWRGEIRFPAQI